MQLFKYPNPCKSFHWDHLPRIYLNRQGFYLTDHPVAVKSSSLRFSLWLFYFPGETSRTVKRLFLFYQRLPTVCPNCAGSISTIGLRSFLFQVSGVGSLLILCCTSLSVALLYLSGSPLSIRRLYKKNVQKLCTLESVSCAVRFSFSPGG